MQSSKEDDLYVSSLYQLEIGLAILCRRLYRAIVQALHIGRELVEAGDGARRLLVGRFELLALGRVLVDLAEDLGGWKSVAMVRRYRKVVDDRLDDVMDAFNQKNRRAGIRAVAVAIRRRTDWSAA